MQTPLNSVPNAATNIIPVRAAGQTGLKAQKYVQIADMPNLSRTLTAQVLFLKAEHVFVPNAADLWPRTAPHAMRLSQAILNSAHNAELN